MQITEKGTGTATIQNDINERQVSSTLRGFGEKVASVFTMRRGTIERDKEVDHVYHHRLLKPINNESAMVNAAAFGTGAIAVLCAAATAYIVSITPNAASNPGFISPVAYVTGAISVILGFITAAIVIDSIEENRPSEPTVNLRTFLEEAKAAEMRGDHEAAVSAIMRSAKTVHNLYLTFTKEEYEEYRGGLEMIRDRETALKVYELLEEAAVQDHHPVEITYDEGFRLAIESKAVEIMTYDGRSKGKEAFLNLTTVQNFERLLLAISMAKKWVGQAEVDRLSEILEERLESLHDAQVEYAAVLDTIPESVSYETVEREPFIIHRSSADRYLTSGELGQLRSQERAQWFNSGVRRTVHEYIGGKSRARTLRKNGAEVLASYTKRLAQARQA